MAMVVDNTENMFRAKTQRTQRGFVNLILELYSSYSF
jgi:hypothetical protein